MTAFFNRKKNDQKYEELLQKKQELLKQIDDLKENEQLKIAQSSMCKQRKLFYRKLPLEWMYSIYYTCLDRLKQLCSSTLSPYDTEAALEKINTSVTEGKNDIQYYALLCESFFQTPEGVVLVLRDPYRQVTSQPLKKISAEKAEEWLGMVLIVKVRLNDGMNADFHEIFIERIKQTRYTKDGIKDSNGVEKKITSLAYELFERDWVRGNEYFQKELNVIKRRAESHGWDFIPYYGTSERFFCCIKKPYRFYVVVSPEASVMEVVWENNVNVTHSDVVYFRETYHKRKEIDYSEDIVDQFMGMIKGETKGFDLAFSHGSLITEALELPCLSLDK